MAKDTRDPGQVLRLDGKDCFVEVTTFGLSIDKSYFGFVSYNKNAEKGQRASGSVNIYMPLLEAQVLARDIMSGRIAVLGEKEKKKMEADGKKYANPVFIKQGGTPSIHNNGQAIARTFEISPGTQKPWILCAKQGKAHETKEGLIVMDGKPDITIRVPCTNEQLKMFACAIDVLVQTWTQLRFVPAAAPAMRLAEARRQEAINKAKAESSAAAQANR